MIKRLEQVAALVVAAGLAIVSYWLFFSWAQGGGFNRPARSPRSEAATGLEQPLFAGRVLQGGHMGLHLLTTHRQPKVVPEGHDAIKRSSGILERLAEEGLGELGVGTDAVVERSGIGC